MGVTKGDVGAHEDEAVGEVHAGFVHPVMEKDSACGLGDQSDERAHEVGGEAGPRAGLEMVFDAVAFVGKFQL